MDANDLKRGYEDELVLALMSKGKSDPMETIPASDTLESENARLKKINAKFAEIIEEQRDQIGKLMGMFPLFRQEIRSISALTEKMAAERERTFADFKQNVIAQLMPGMLKLREQMINPMNWESKNETRNIPIGVDESVYSETIHGVVSVFQKDLDALIATVNRTLE